MSLDLIISFNDPGREAIYHPFSFQEVLRRAWWPLAEQLDLSLLQQLECLVIRDRDTAERLVHELEAVYAALKQADAINISENDAAYMLQRIGQVKPLILNAIEHWGDIMSLSL